MHVPVLLKEVIEYLNPRPNQNFIDGTMGNGGHSDEILKHIKPYGKVLGIELNPMAVKKLKTKYSDLIKADRVRIEQGNYSDMEEIVGRVKFFRIDGIILDLGMSSENIEESGLGFSFQKDEPLNMRYDALEDGSKNITAADIINGFSEKQLADLFYKQGGETRSRRIAKKIVSSRKHRRIETAKELADIISEAVPGRGKRHPATKVFHALRIEVNHELENLANALPQAERLVGKGGRIAIISYHSLEDRIVKDYFRKGDREGRFNLLTKKPVRPKAGEIIKNPRSRSANLRAVEKL